MSKVLKNSLVILLVALFAAVSLSACGQSDKKEPAKAAEKKVEQKAAAAETAPSAAGQAKEAAVQAVDAAKEAGAKAVEAGGKAVEAAKEAVAPKKEVPTLVLPKNMD